MKRRSFIKSTGQWQLLPDFDDYSFQRAGWDPENDQFTRNRVQLEASPLYQRPARDWEKGL